MKRIMRVKTNAYSMIVSYDAEEKMAMVLSDSSAIDTSEIVLNNIEDDSSWDRFDDIEDVEEFIGCNAECDASEIIEEIEKEL